MSLSTLLRRLTGRQHRKRSFYESQHVMRDVVEAIGPIDMRLLPEEELRTIAGHDASAARRMAAEKELALRLARRPDSRDLH
jgi:hypothetical protein